MDTHPIQASPQRWIVALGLLLVAGVQGLFLWGYTDDGIWAVSYTHLTLPTILLV